MSGSPGNKNSNESTNELRRRYFLCKKRKTRKKTARVTMEDEEIATDFKLKQFLADVEKFSKRSKQRQEEKVTKPHTSNKIHVRGPMEKRGLFENGLLSKPSVKGILGLKNKARLTGHLEKLLNEESLTSPSEVGSSKESEYAFEKCILNNEDMKINSEATEKISDRKQLPNDDPESVNHPDAEGGCSDGQNISVPPKDTELLEGIDDLLKYSESKIQECFLKFEGLPPEILSKSREEIFADCQKKLVDIAQKNFVRKTLENEEGFVGNLRKVCEEYILSKRPQMIDNSVQTAISCVKSNVSLHVIEEPIIDEHARLSNFFDEEKIEEKHSEPFNFQPVWTGDPKDKDKMKQSVASCFPDKKRAVLETPKGFKTHFVELSMQGEAEKRKKSKMNLYVPAILSPPSPGRQYGISPDSIPDLNKIDEFLPKKEKSMLGFRNASNFESDCGYFKNKMPSLFTSLNQPSSSGSQQTAFTGSHQPAFERNLNTSLTYQQSSTREKLLDFHSTSPQKRSYSFENLKQRDEATNIFPFSDELQFHKRSKLTFSPHRL